MDDALPISANRQLASRISNEAGRLQRPQDVARPLNTASA